MVSASFFSNKFYKTEYYEIDNSTILKLTVSLIAMHLILASNH